ncbi:acetate--CoA ligase [Klenkia taihuensis]|uniref:Acetate--CoA ligase n=1 Tax=Klenkia taihuensis TaxID=1225127 RepID=A0A1I1TMK4_9ACTN|nr:acetate--CoA ligase [Klenkia taihuensis]GHE12851.1 acetyl-coenzyme A synthetase [Klenkia taihuensis]SFD56710.1 acetyl-coenzyme A synthetase [Klenkia taihuensis]
MTDALPPPPAFAAVANVRAGVRERADADPPAFWAEQAGRLTWDRPWDTAHDDRDWPTARWFDGGRLNVAVNCVDRHVDAGRGEKVALHWEGEPGDRRTVTYAQLHEQVQRLANGLTELGVGPGDRVVLYLPVLVETVVATMACARIGAVVSLVFGGFSADALRFRVADTGATVVVASDGQFRRGAAVPVKSVVDEAVAGLDHVAHVLVVRRTGSDDVPWTPGRDVWWHDLLDRQPAAHTAQSFPAEHPLFIVYTSGTTGRPKGLVHTSGGYLTQASWTHWALFDLRDDDVYWCQADLAWVTAHTYVLYGPLSNGATQVVYEGSPLTPHPGRHFEVIERYGVTTYYTAPTLVRTFMKHGPQLPAGHDLSSLRLLGSVGEAINPEAWRWLHEHVGGGRCPVVDTWWQSETGAAVIAPLPGVTPLKPGSATLALPGMAVAVVDDDGRETPPGVEGNLVITRPGPGMARTVWGDHDRFVRSYWAPYADRRWYLAGDSASRDEDGYVWIGGRIDDVLNVSGHRLSSIELESALVSHPRVAEAAVVGAPDDVTGQRIVAFVITRAGDADDSGLAEELRAHVATRVGAVAKPREVVVVTDLPKTRSGKIMRRLMADMTAGRGGGDTTSLTDPAAMTAVESAWTDHRRTSPGA